MRRRGIKVRTYENVRVFIEGTAGRGRNHWASQEFAECIGSSEEITYFSGSAGRPAIAIHGNHIHVFSRDAKGSLIPLDPAVAEIELIKFVKTLRAMGVHVELENG